MKYIPNRFQFSENPADIDTIKYYYDNVKQSLDERFDSNNPINVGYSLSSLKKEHNQAFLELNIEGGFALLSAVECIFRTDFVCRCRKKRKENIDNDFKNALNKVDKLYKIDLKEIILERWKSEFPDYTHIFSSLKDRMEYRNWIAHGRYWNNYSNAGTGKYSFDSLYLEIANLLLIIGHRLLRPESVGNPVRH